MAEEKFQVQITNIKTIAISLPAQLIVDHLLDLINNDPETIETIGKPVNRDNLAALNLGNLPLGGMNEVIASLSYQESTGTITNPQTSQRVTAHSRQAQRMAQAPATS